MKKLNLKGNAIKDEGLIKISEVLMNNTTLIELNISHNEVTPLGILSIYIHKLK